jgi:hypothetical protein
MKKVSCLVAVGMMVLCVGLAPAKADLFGFTISNPETTFDGASSFETKVSSGTTADLYRNLAPAGTAEFGAGAWGTGDFLMAMTISGITAATADGDGTFSFTDADGDIIAGVVNGTWIKAGQGGIFNGSLADVTYTPVVNNTFDGQTGSVSMVFNSDQPWNGTFIQVTFSGAWFTPKTAFDVTGGSIDATVTPVPAALLIGLLGLGTAGLKLRKFA